MGRCGRYSAMVAQNKYDYEKTGKEPELILDRGIELVIISKKK